MGPVRHAATSRSRTRWTQPTCHGGYEIIEVREVREPSNHDVVIDIDVVVHEHITETDRPAQVVRKSGVQHSVRTQ